MILTPELLSQRASSTDKVTMDTTQQNIELTARSVLLRALIEKRVICGIPSAIKTLSKSSEDSLFCFLAQPNKEDSATNMSQTLLEAYCYENDIYVIKVDCAEKLGRILGTCASNTCALIQKTWDKSDDGPVECLTEAEHSLVDYCELNWDIPNQILKLPG